MSPRKITAQTHNNLLQGNTSRGLFLYVKRVLRDLNYKILLFTFYYLHFFQYDKSRTEKFSKAKSIFKYVFYKMSLSEFKGIVLSFNFGPVYLTERQMIDCRTNATKFP